MRFRTALGAVAVAGLLAPPAVSARPAALVAAEPATVLAGVNHISGDRSGWVDVRLPARATLDFPLLRRNRDLLVEGDGRFAGIVLTKGPAFFEGPTLVGAVIRTCGEPGCTGRAVNLTNPMNMRAGSRIALPPGAYRLYLVTDGAPVDVRLTLHGLAGTRRIAPGLAADVEIGELPVHVGGGDSDPVYVAGAPFSLDAPAFVLDGLWLEGAPSGFTDLGTCLYRGRPPEVPDAVAYSPACEQLGAQPRSSTRIAASLGFAEMLLLFDSPLGEGEWSAGSHVECTCFPELATSLRVVLER